MQDSIRTPRLLLRRARLDDLPDLFAVFSDARAMRYWDTPPHTDPALTRRWLGSMAALPPDTDDFIVERDGRAIGKAGCWRPYEIGFILHPDHWGQGLATEALSAVIPHVFATLPAPALTAEVDPRNAASSTCSRAWAFTKPAAPNAPSSSATSGATASTSICPAPPDKKNRRNSRSAAISRRCGSGSSGGRHRGQRQARTGRNSPARMATQSAASPSASRASTSGSAFAMRRTASIMAAVPLMYPVCSRNVRIPLTREFKGIGNVSERLLTY